MESRALTLTLWQVRRWGRILGWESLACLGLAFLALCFAWQARLWSDETRALHLAGEQIATKTRPLAEGADAAESVRRVETFLACLPTRDEVPERLKRLLLLAQRSGIQVAKGEYRELPDASARLIRYQIIFPVRGGASHLQGFVLAALNAEPALMLDGMAFHRDSALSGAVESRLRFTLLVRQP